MFIGDYHTHTSFSSDAEDTVFDMVNAAYKLGLKEIAITDHVDYDYPNSKYPFLIDYTKYFEKLNEAKESFKGKINVLFGIEAGLMPTIGEKLKTLDDYDFDFIIGSSHVVSGEEIYFDSPFYIGKTKKEAYTEYFNDVLNNIRLYDFFCVYGHLDYVSRYGIYGDNSLKYSEFSEVIDEILKLLIKKGKGIEVNTSGFRYKNNACYPSLEILKRYKALGGEIITVGSDAHRTSDVGKNFKEAYDALRAAGFTAVSRFKNKKVYFEDI